MKTSDAVLDDLGNVDSVENGPTHTTDPDGVVPLLAVLAIQNRYCVGDIAVLTMTGHDANFIIRALLPCLALSNTAIIVKYRTGRHFVD